MKGLTFREYDVTGDEPFVFATWMRAHRDIAQRLRTGESVTPRALDRYRIAVARTVNESPPKMLCSVDNAATLLGWVCASAERLHFAYLRPELRCMGIGREMVRHAMGDYRDHIECTHRWPWKSGRYIYEPKRRVA